MNVNSFISWLESKDQDLSKCKTTLELFPHLGLVDVVISKRYKTVAGRAMGTRQIVLAQKMFAEGIDEVKDTFLHELGHICTHNNKSRGHGPEWKQWCHVLGLPNVDTYHSIEAMSYKRRPKKVVGNCHTCEIQIWRRKKLQKNLTYICLQCNGYITKL